MLPYPDIDPVAITIGPLAIHWYGMMYLIGFVSAWFLAIKRAKNRPDLHWTNQQIADLVFYCALGVILGARLGYVLFYGLDQALDNPLWIFKVWEGGMSFHGGFLGVLIAFWYSSKRFNKNFFNIADFIAPLVPIGLGAGRIGNFIGGELWGRATDLPWGMIFPKANDGIARHPSQLYEAFFEGLVLFTILWWFSARPRPRMAVSGVFALGYGFFRFAVEFVREPDGDLGFILFNWLTMGQLLSLPMIIIGILLLIAAYKKKEFEVLAEPKTKRNS